MSHQPASSHRPSCPASARAIACGLLAACLLSSPAFACAVCFGDPNSSQTQGMNWAIITMLGFIAAVFAGLGAFAFALWRRGQAPESECAATGRFELREALTAAAYCPEGLPS